jgi:hypothetical protein
VKSPRLPGRCLFCGGGRLSKEHFWPQWASHLLGDKRVSGAYIEEFVVRTPKALPLSHTRKERPGQVTTKKLRVVCVKCNNEWMSVLESSVKAFVTPMILGQAVILSPVFQGLFAQWVTLKLMVAEQNRPTESIWHQSHRDAFLRARTIPSGMRIWIAQCYSDLWSNAYLRHASTLGKDRASRPTDSKKNSQASALGIGQLFVMAMASTAQNVDLGDFFSFDERITPIWPPSAKDIHWPPVAPLTHDQANRVAMSFDELMRHPNVVWEP